jgi:topoisomerase IA-like protein
MSVNKFELPIDENHKLIIGKYGPVVKTTSEGNTTFLPVKRNLDIDALKQQSTIQLTDVVQVSETEPETPDIRLGKYRGEDLFIKSGKYGTYVQWANNRVSLKQEFPDTPYDKISYREILTFLDKDTLLDAKKPVNLVRELSPSLSIRSGKYGDYIMHKRGRKPAFLKLKGFGYNYKTCPKTTVLEWIKKTYNIG